MSDDGIPTGDGEQPVTVTIIDALTCCEQSTESRLENRPLYEYIDPDALEMLIQRTPPETNLYIEFEVSGKTVGVYGDGSVVVE